MGCRFRFLLLYKLQYDSVAYTDNFAAYQIILQLIYIINSRVLLHENYISNAIIHQQNILQQTCLK